MGAVIVTSFYVWLAEFHSKVIGAIAVTVLAFLLGIVWEILLDLDDPHTGVWMIVPPDRSGS